MKRVLVFALGLGSVLMAGSAQANLVSNGDFETFDPTGLTNGGDYWKMVAADNNLSSWSVGTLAGDNSIDIVTGSYTHFGTYGVDLAGTSGPGSISQNLVLTSAGLYRLTFYAGFFGDTLNSKVDINFGGTLFSQPVANIGSSTAPSTSLVKYTIVGNLSLGSNSLILSTLRGNNTNGNLFIDNVSVEAVPEPLTMALLGGGAIAGFARLRRRKQTT